MNTFHRGASGEEAGSATGTAKVLMGNKQAWLIGIVAPMDAAA